LVGSRRRLLAISTLESLDASRHVDDLLLAGIKRMASGTQLHLNLGLSGLRLEAVATAAFDFGRTVLRMNSLFHDPVLLAIDLAGGKPPPPESENSFHGSLPPGKE